VNQAANQGNLPPKLIVTPNLLDFGNFVTTRNTTVVNGGGGNLSVNAPVVQTDSGGDWLAAQLAGGRLTVDVNRSSAGLSDGEYSGRINLTSNGGSASVEVRMRVGPNPGENICGGAQDCIFILALDMLTFETVGSASTGFAGPDGSIDTPEDQYRYHSFPVQAGTFFVLGGTDFDQDGFIGDEGELIGGWPVGNQLGGVSISSGQETEGVDFNIETVGLSLGASGDLNKSGDQAGFRIKPKLFKKSLLSKILEWRSERNRGER